MKYHAYDMANRDILRVNRDKEMFRDERPEAADLHSGSQACTTKFMRILFNVLPRVYLMDDCKQKGREARVLLNISKIMDRLAILKQSS